MSKDTWIGARSVPCRSVIDDAIDVDLIFDYEIEGDSVLIVFKQGTQTTTAKLQFEQFMRFVNHIKEVKENGTIRN